MKQVSLYKRLQVEKSKWNRSVFVMLCEHFMNIGKVMEKLWKKALSIRALCRYRNSQKW